MMCQQSRIEEQSAEINIDCLKIDTQVQKINHLRSTVESQNQDIINLNDTIDDQDQEIKNLRETIHYHSAGHNGGNPYPVYSTSIANANNARHFTRRDSLTKHEDVFFRRPNDIVTVQSQPFSAFYFLL